jgi:hypothetical protein
MRNNPIQTDHISRQASYSDWSEMLAQWGLVMAIIGVVATIYFGLRANDPFSDRGQFEVQQLCVVDTGTVGSRADQISYPKYHGRAIIKNVGRLPIQKVTFHVRYLGPMAVVGTVEVLGRTLESSAPAANVKQYFVDESLMPDESLAVEFAIPSWALLSMSGESLKNMPLFGVDLLPRQSLTPKQRERRSCHEADASESSCLVLLAASGCAQRPPLGAPTSARHQAWNWAVAIMAANVSTADSNYVQPPIRFWSSGAEVGRQDTAAGWFPLRTLGVVPKLHTAKKGT